ncbi:MAG: hypothetical protein ACRDTG_02150 [Pseudonocardiaceae bacterium]
MTAVYFAARRMASLRRRLDVIPNQPPTLVEVVQEEFKKGRRQQWLYFLAGLLLAIPLGVAGNLIFEWFMQFSGLILHTRGSR